MIVQVYRNTETNMILMHSKSHILDKKIYVDYELIEEFEGETWNECAEKITKKYLTIKK